MILLFSDVTSSLPIFLFFFSTSYTSLNCSSLDNFLWLLGAALHLLALCLCVERARAKVPLVAPKGLRLPLKAG